MTENDTVWLIVLIPIIWLLGFSILWSGIIWLTSFLSGWATLAKAYPADALATPATCWSFQTAILRFGSNYTGVLTVCADSEGVYVRPLFLFRPGHAPLFVPWSEISGRKRRFFLYQVIELRFERAPDIPFRVYGRLADRLEQAAAGAWAYAR